MGRKQRATAAAGPLRGGWWGRIEWREGAGRCCMFGCWDDCATSGQAPAAQPHQGVLIGSISSSSRRLPASAVTISTADSCRPPSWVSRAGGAVAPAVCSAETPGAAAAASRSSNTRAPKQPRCSTCWEHIACWCRADTLGFPGCACFQRMPLRLGGSARAVGTVRGALQAARRLVSSTQAVDQLRSPTFRPAKIVNGRLLIGAEQDGGVLLPDPGLSGQLCSVKPRYTTVELNRIMQGT
jgi:hypothetical protein